jgi:hypothetical protein
VSKDFEVQHGAQGRRKAHISLSMLKDIVETAREIKLGDLYVLAWENGCNIGEWSNIAMLYVHPI